MAVMNKKVGFMGGGEIALVLASSIINNGIVTAGNITVYDPNPERLTMLAEKYGVKTAASNRDVVAASDYIFSCIRSEYVAEAAKEVAGSDMKGKAIISISSGVPILLWEKYLPDAAVARSLPNPPSKIGVGAIAVAFNRFCSDEQQKDMSALFGPMGECHSLREDQIDAVTAVTCLAHFLSLFQASIEGSVLMGIDYKTSRALVMQTVRGALKVWEDRPDKLGEILDQSATPGGITARMLYYLDQHGFKHAVKGCIEEGTLRTRAFGEKIREQLQ